VRPEEERAWDVVRRAYEERTPQPRRRRVHPALIPALVVLAAVIVAAVLSPPGRAVFERVREAVGVEHADPALFSLPAPGRLLVVSTDGGGVWLVRDNGFKRRLGGFADALEDGPAGRREHGWRDRGREDDERRDQQTRPCVSRLRCALLERATHDLPGPLLFGRSHDSSFIRSRPRRSRELTVPRGMSSRSAISPGVYSST